MKVSIEETGQRQAALNIEVEPDELEKSLEKAYRRMVNKTNVPGFRRGKAPRAMLERYMGRAALLDNVLDDLVSETYRRAVEEKGLDTIGPPEVEILDRAPVIFKATVSLRPIVELGDYHQLSFTKEPVEVSEEEIDAAIEHLRFVNTPWEPAERPASSGDLITIDVEGTVEGQNIWKQAGLQYQILPNSAVPVPGFAEQLTGLERGQGKEFALPFPADYPRKEMAGKECLFKVTVHEVKEKRLPELNDEFAKGVGDGFETMEALRQQVASGLKDRAEREATRRVEDDAVMALVGMSRIEFPPILQEQGIDRLVKEQLEAWGEGNIKLDDYLKRLGKTEEQLREEWKPLAIKRVSRSLVLERLTEVEKVEVTAEEIEAEIERLAKQAGEKEQTLRRIAFSSPEGRQSVKQMLLTRKTLRRLVDIVTKVPEEVTPSPSGEEGLAGDD